MKDGRIVTGSLPSRERGLKYTRIHGRTGGIRVAPFAGAWIEIRHFPDPDGRDPVAPFAGAWIEIVSNNVVTSENTMVAPFAGAWIEIGIAGSDHGIIRPSLPSRERGLKFPGVRLAFRIPVSLPSRERGLKSYCAV